MLMKTIRLVVLSVIAVETVFLATAFAHGGEDHGDKKVVVRSGQMNVNVGYSETAEVVVKYPTPKPAEELTMLVFLTDVKTNAPMEATTLSLAINQVSSGQPDQGNSTVVRAASRPVQVTASPTDTPGIYQVRVTFPEVGQYDLALKLGGEHADVNIAGVVVPGADAQPQANGMRERTTLPLAVAAAMLFILAGAMSYIFWLRPHGTGRTSELKPIYHG